MKTAADVYNLLCNADIPEAFTNLELSEGPGCSCDIFQGFVNNNRTRFIDLFGQCFINQYKYTFTTKNYPAIFICVLTDQQMQFQANQDFLVGMNAQLVHSYYHGAHGNMCNLFLIDKAAINWDYIYDILEMEINEAN